jgi:acyl carrier protein
LTSTAYTMAPQRNQVRSLLVDCIENYAAQTGLDIVVTDDTRLLGPSAPLDSLGLVSVLAGFEAAINDVFATDIVLADERAMSLERSPFRTVSSLIDYASTLLDEARNSHAS